MNRGPHGSKFYVGIWGLLWISCAQAATSAPEPGDKLRDDILIADFENTDYGDWKLEGEAFGPGPAQGTLPNQMHVSGYRGEGLVNSYYDGDRTTGMLTSAPIKIEREYINFLIGGGKHPGKTCINLLIGGEVVRTATGANDEPGGSEQLDWHTWEVAQFEGKTAIIQIVDQHTGGWGHVNVDQILQSDRKLQAQPASRDIVVRRRYLHLPVKKGAPKRRMKYIISGTTLREFEIELADDQPDYWVFSDLGDHSGQKLTIEVDRLRADSKGLALIIQSHSLPGQDQLYKEKHRPRFHFTSRRGWHNDPNGLVYHKGEYHLFYQHNPYGTGWGNMHWGHAISKDLVHWEEVQIALYPRRFGDWCFSGSGIVDTQNSAGFQTKDEPAIVVAYTSTGRGESIAYSNDLGRTWTEYERNPVVRHRGRDPKIIWHKPTKRWIMAVYHQPRGKRTIGFYSSPDLKKWTYESQIEGFYECPDLFELAVDGDRKNTKWVLYAADGKYILGQFDGKRFHKESGKHQLWYGNFYAAQTFSNTPDGRRIQIGWGRGISFPGMPFNQQMTFPVELTLRNTDEGVRMFAEPVKEIKGIQQRKRSWNDLMVKPEENLLHGLKGELFDIRAEFEVGEAQAIGFSVRGVPVVYDAKKKMISCQRTSAPFKPVEGKVRLRILVDRGSIEVFAGSGRVALCVGVIPNEESQTLGLSSKGGNIRLRSLTIFELQSAWNRPASQ